MEKIFDEVREHRQRGRRKRNRTFQFVGYKLADYDAPCELDRARWIYCRSNPYFTDFLHSKFCAYLPPAALSYPEQLDKIPKAFGDDDKEEWLVETSDGSDASSSCAYFPDVADRMSTDESTCTDHEVGPFTLCNSTLCNSGERHREKPHVLQMDEQHQVLNFQRKADAADLNGVDCVLHIYFPYEMSIDVLTLTLQAAEHGIRSIKTPNHVRDMLSLAKETGMARGYDEDLVWMLRERRGNNWVAEVNDCDIDRIMRDRQLDCLSDAIKTEDDSPQCWESSFFGSSAGWMNAGMIAGFYQGSDAPNSATVDQNEWLMEQSPVWKDRTRKVGSYQRHLPEYHNIPSWNGKSYQLDSNQMPTPQLDTQQSAVEVAERKWKEHIVCFGSQVPSPEIDKSRGENGYDSDTPDSAKEVEKGKWTPIWNCHPSPEYSETPSWNGTSCQHDSSCQKLTPEYKCSSGESHSCLAPIVEVPSETSDSPYIQHSSDESWAEESSGESHEPCTSERKDNDYYSRTNLIRPKTPTEHKNITPVKVIQSSSVRIPLNMRGLEAYYPYSPSLTGPDDELLPVSSDLLHNSTDGSRRTLPKKLPWRLRETTCRTYFDKSGRVFFDSPDVKKEDLDQSVDEFDKNLETSENEAATPKRQPPVSNIERSRHTRNISGAATSKDSGQTGKGFRQDATVKLENHDMKKPEKLLKRSTIVLPPISIDTPIALTHLPSPKSQRMPDSVRHNIEVSITGETTPISVSECTVFTPPQTACNDEQLANNDLHHDRFYVDFLRFGTTLFRRYILQVSDNKDDVCAAKNRFLDLLPLVGQSIVNLAERDDTAGDGT
ncbi:hypothetical protein BJ742DRAFT_767180 [Cladochytrium replicatum]|nr:hypothetical protein BJ742DRAFT_767180 [Cladochytrium replicatum]